MSGSLTDDRLSKTTMAHIWVKMIGLYGYKWIKPNGDMPLDDKGALTEIAATWQSALAGISTQQVADALRGLLKTLPEWPPAAIEFRRLCISRDDMPTAEQVMHMIIRATYAQGSIAERYRHPLAWAVANHKDIDSFSFRTASNKQALSLIEPIYKELLCSGWLDFTEEEKTHLKAITAQKEFNPQRHKDRTLKLSESVNLSEFKAKKAEPKPEITEEEKQANIERVEANKKAMLKMLAGQGVVIPEQVTV